MHLEMVYSIHFIYFAKRVWWLGDKGANNFGNTANQGDQGAPEGIWRLIWWPFVWANYSDLFPPSSHPQNGGEKYGNPPQNARNNSGLGIIGSFAQNLSSFSFGQHFWRWDFGKTVKQFRVQDLVNHTKVDAHLMIGTESVALERRKSLARLGGKLSPLTGTWVAKVCFRVSRWVDLMLFFRHGVLDLATFQMVGRFRIGSSRAKRCHFYSLGKTLCRRIKEEPKWPDPT